MISDKQTISAFTLQIKGKILDLSRPCIMGILNVTPDSFYSGSRLQQQDAFLTKAKEMLHEGAAILDIGGQSTRPGAELVSVDEEIERVIPFINLLRKELGPQIWISIDTFNSAVAGAALVAGADMVNDVSGGGLDPEMWPTVAQHHAAYVLMHMRGNPQTMNSLSNYQDMLTEIIDELRLKIDGARASGIEELIIDPGFGFSKTIDQNFRLLKNLNVLQVFNLPILVGISRKSMIWKSLNTSPEQALNGTTVLHTLALQHSPQILRVHDVKQAAEAISLVQKHQKS
jgi:dihydropteroate synthase